MRHSATNPPTVNAQNGLLKYCWLITMHEKAEQFKSRTFFFETEKEVDKTSEEGNSLQVFINKKGRVKSGKY